MRRRWYQHGIDGQLGPAETALRLAAAAIWNPDAEAAETLPTLELANLDIRQPQGLRVRHTARDAATAEDAGLARLEVVLALAAFAVLCVVVLRVRPFLVESRTTPPTGLRSWPRPRGHFFTLSSAQAQALATRLGGSRAA